MVALISASQADVVVEAGEDTTHCEPIYERHTLLRLDGNDYKTSTLGSESATLIVLGNYGELIAIGDFAQRWKCWFISIHLFSYWIDAYDYTTTDQS